MGTEPNTTEQAPTETTPEHVDTSLEAARHDDLDDVLSLASAGVPLDSKDSQGRTVPSMFELSPTYILIAALHMAAANGHLDVVEFLIDRVVDINAFNEEKNTPLHWACLNGHLEVIDY
ncbi:Acyl-CoA-binding domain-containing protein 2 [Morella rubra]|uniref:Acyl-CoA-binding domain-containing protein 2 n=1 Tax=Morella rubra TaxID=262757 RepID=A0A6A1VMQ6_9ROSI|nr:Acyl-CoA-binding domain-containing protein 2 [Morella rubra]